MNKPSIKSKLDSLRSVKQKLDSISPTVPQRTTPYTKPYFKCGYCDSPSCMCIERQDNGDWDWSLHTQRNMLIFSKVKWLRDWAKDVKGINLDWMHDGSPIIPSVHSPRFAAEYLPPGEPGALSKS